MWSGRLCPSAPLLLAFALALSSLAVGSDARCQVPDAPANEAEDAPEPLLPRPRATDSERLGGFGGLWMAALVLAGMAVVFVRVKKKGGPSSLLGSASHLQLMGRLSLGPQSQIVAVRSGDEILLLGVTPKGISLLRTMDRSQWQHTSSFDAALSERGLKGVFEDAAKKGWAKVAKSSRPGAPWRTDSASESDNNPPVTNRGGG